MAATASAALLLTLTTGTASGSPTAAGAALATTEPTTFTLSSFNVLGSTHTEPGGRHADMMSGVERIRLAVKLLDKRGVDVVGLQELQLDQFEEFYRVAGDRYGVFPGGVDRRTVQNSIAWSLDSWYYVAGHTVPIPYFDGVEWQMPVVLLQHRYTGQQAYFANFHNPATNRRHPGQGKWRDEAVAREVALARSLYHESGLPVFVTGDMNEREEYYCAMAGGAPMKAANGGSYRKGVCTPPPRPMPVNWIFGGKHRAKFSNYVRDDSRLVNKITDHFVVRADVSIKPQA